MTQRGLFILIQSHIQTIDKENTMPYIRTENGATKMTQEEFDAYLESMKPIEEPVAEE